MVGVRLVKSSSVGKLTAWMDVIEPFLVIQQRMGYNPAKWTPLNEKNILISYKLEIEIYLYFLETKHLFIMEWNSNSGQIHSSKNNI